MQAARARHGFPWRWWQWVEMPVRQFQERGECAEGPKSSSRKEECQRSEDGASIKAHTVGDDRMMGLERWVAKFVDMIAAAAAAMILLMLEERNSTTLATAACEPRRRSMWWHLASRSNVSSTTYIEMLHTFRTQSHSGTTSRNIHNSDDARLALLRQLWFPCARFVCFRPPTGVLFNTALALSSSPEQLVWWSSEVEVYIYFWEEETRRKHADMKEGWGIWNRTGWKEPCEPGFFDVGYMYF